MILGTRHEAAMVNTRKHKFRGLNTPLLLKHKL
ncbi:unnamed protein product [Schistosoma margrebowiei]|uniref:Uncharacterized protein n=1 Tax=Schistosoma margrebowiei TaxID=48269 RepID=A0A3P8ERK3_9TREM|nr:unnamed protein product [Schistosoma margrebowiei]